MVEVGGRPDRSVSTGSVAVGRFALDVGEPGGTTVRRLRHHTLPPAELAAALEAEAPRTAGEVAEAVVEGAGDVTGHVDRAAKLFTKIVRGEVDVATVAGEIEKLIGLLGRLDREDRHEDVLRVARVLAKLLTLATRWVALVQTLKIAARAAQELGDSEALGWALHELGTLALGADDAQAATRDLDEARRLRKATGDEVGLAATEHNLRAARRPRLVRNARVAGAALVLGVVLALVVAGGDDPAPVPTTQTRAAETIDTATATSTATTTTRTPPPPADSTDPTPTLDPVGDAGGLTNDPTPELTGTAGTAPGDEQRVTVLVFDGEQAAGEPRQRRPAPASSDGRYTTQALALASGTYTARAQQRDGAGNSGTSEAVTFTVDADAPTVRIARPEGGSRVTAGRVVFSGTAGSAPGDDTVVVITVGASPPTRVAVLRGTWEVTLPVDGVFDESADDWTAVTATVRQGDAAGNTASATVSFTPVPVE